MVVIKDGIRNLVTHSPFIAPIPIPMANITIIATKTSNILSAIVIIIAPTTLDSAKIAVTEKSILPFKNTYVMPHASIISSDDWISMLNKFWGFENLGTNKIENTRNRIKINRAGVSLNISTAKFLISFFLDNDSLIINTHLV